MNFTRITRMNAEKANQDRAAQFRRAENRAGSYIE
jgi:hypothetical protein